MSAVMETSTRETFLIPERNMYDLRRKLEKLDKRATKLGMGHIGFEIIDTKIREIVHDYGVIERKTSYVVTISGETPRLGGWKFIGTLQHLEGENIIRAVPNEAIPNSFRTADPQNCDHCHTRRTRVDTFIVLNDSGEYKQVGRQCVADFVGNADPKDVAAMCEMLANARAIALSEEDDESSDRLGGGKPYYDLKRFLQLASQSVTDFGWISRTAAKLDSLEATAATVLRSMSAVGVHGYKTCGTESYPCRNHLKVGDDAAAEAAAAIEWGRNELVAISEKDIANDYLYNLRVAVGLDEIDARLTGIVASLIPTYRRYLGYEIERKARAANSVSTCVGSIGERIQFEATVTNINDRDSDFGATHIHSLLDSDGNVYVWFASRERLNVGSKYAFKATVKKHGEFRGIKQTTITRAKATKTEQ